MGSLGHKGCTTRPKRPPGRCTTRSSDRLILHSSIWQSSRLLIGRFVVRVHVGERRGFQRLLGVEEIVGVSLGPVTVGSDWTRNVSSPKRIRCRCRHREGARGNEAAPALAGQHREPPLHRTMGAPGFDGACCFEEKRVEKRTVIS